MSSIYQGVVVVEVVVVVAAAAAVGLHVWHLQWLFAPVQEIFLHNVIHKVRCVVCEISDFHGIDLENFFLLGSYSVRQVIYHITTIVMTFQPLEMKMSNYVKIRAAHCATPEDQNWNCFCQYGSEIYSQKIHSGFPVPQFVVLCTDTLITPIWENNALIVCIYIIAENSVSRWTFIYSVILTTVSAALLCRLDMKRNTIWYPTDVVIILDSVFSKPKDDESCSSAVCEQSCYESDPDVL